MPIETQSDANWDPIWCQLNPQSNANRQPIWCKMRTNLKKIETQSDANWIPNKMLMTTNLMPIVNQFEDNREPIWCRLTPNLMLSTTNLMAIENQFEVNWEPFGRIGLDHQHQSKSHSDWIVSSELDIGSNLMPIDVLSNINWLLIKRQSTTNWHPMKHKKELMCQSTANWIPIKIQSDDNLLLI